MKSMQLTATVSVDGKLTVQLPAIIPPGEHRVVLVMEDKFAAPPVEIPKPRLKLNVLKWQTWPAESTFRREELYEDDGR